MMPEHAFVAERALASHCPALLRPGPGPADLLPALARTAERLAKALRGALAPMLGGEPPMVACEAPVEIDWADYAASNAGLVAHSLFGAGAQAMRLLASVDAEAVLRLVDRAFGGPGEPPHPLPRELPLSAELMVQRLETVVAGRLGAALGSDDPAAIRPLRRDTSLAQLQPFADAPRLAVLTLTVTEGTRAPWAIRVAFPFETLADLFGHGERPPVASGSAGPADPLGEPFGDMPMPISAVLVDVALPLSAISGLEVGQILSVPIARSVPLRVAGQTVAHGSIGAVDDRVAVQLTQLS